MPKIASRIIGSQYRSIACCSTAYKLVFKVLMLRLQQHIGPVLSVAQAAFVPETQNIENVLLATDLVKGFGRGYMIPRCIIKMGLKKASDSIEWPFCII